jgi:hypothetical protein
LTLQAGSNNRAIINGAWLDHQTYSLSLTDTHSKVIDKPTIVEINNEILVISFANVIFRTQRRTFNVNFSL